VDARRQLNELITAASLPPVESTRELAGGFDNQLLVGVLRDGRSVLLRQCPEPASNPDHELDFSPSMRWVHHGCTPPTTLARSWSSSFPARR
jgi:hypothetical protein